MIEGMIDVNNQQVKMSDTLKEIKQQPSLWKKTIKEISQQKNSFHSFLNEIENKHQRVRVIFTGAGSSAFVGETIFPHVRGELKSRGWDVECISTTNLTATPHYFLDENVPTIMVSFARSGNSPESIAAVELGEQIIKEFYEITITCNRDGALAKREREEGKQLVIILPEEANDKGLAMTSSFSTMMLTALYLFTNNKEQFRENVEKITAAGEGMLKQCEKILPHLVKEEMAKLVYLGSGVFEGLSRESALKFLELTGGKYSTMFDTPLGFRHGPKSFLDHKTVVVMYVSNDEYTRQYDLDMLKELFDAKNRGSLVVISAKKDSFIENHSDIQIVNVQLESLQDVWLTFVNIIFAQFFAYEKSVHSGFSPDNPSPDGLINRVVQGVKIYPYGGKV